MLHFDPNPISIGHLFIEIWMIFWSSQTMKNIRICHLFQLITQTQYSRHQTHFLWSCHICDVIKQNQSEVGNSDFKIKPNKAENVFCFLLFFGNLQLLISLEPIDQFQWGFLQNVAVKMVHTISSKNENLIWPTSDWFCLITPQMIPKD